MHQRSGCRAVPPEAQKGGRATSAKQVAGGTKKNKRPRLLRDVIQEFQTKVIDAAKKLQLELSDSAAQPVLNAVEQFAPMDTAASVDLDEEPALSELGARQKKRARDSSPELSSIRELQRWVAEEPIASCSSADAQRIREAVAVLSRPKPRQEDVRPLQSKWQLAQKKDRKPGPLGDVIQELQTKVIKSAKTRQLELSDNPEQPASSHFDLLSIRDVQRWVADEPIASCGSADA